MGSWLKIFQLTKNFNIILFVKPHFASRNRASKIISMCKTVFGGSTFVYSLFKWNFTVPIYVASSGKHDDSKKTVRPRSRERKFVLFASVEYDGQLYMTPQDFLESVIEEEPRWRRKRKVFSTEEMERIRNSTPTLSQGTVRLFRNLGDQGVMSYTEYLFLLSILTRPESGFRIAFNMFDADQNGCVNKNEYLVIERIFSSSWKGKHDISDEIEGKSEVSPKPVHDQYVDDEQGLQRKHNVDTTLSIHFFGTKGLDELHYDEFKRFMQNLQTEILELEFNEFSKGLSTISEVDFARILLRYNYLDTDKFDIYLDRLQDRIKDVRGISFGEFYAFCQFLNNFEDFRIAMRMYTLSGNPISKVQFRRAAKICTGTILSKHLVNTVFAIFDKDGDGLLSYREFVGIMKDRLHRGFKPYAKKRGWNAFKVCLKQEMKNHRKVRA